MATMRILLNVSPFGAKPKNETFSGTISLPQTIQGAVRINSATLRMKWVRVYTEYCYLDFSCGTASGSTTVLEGSDGSAVIREVPLTVNSVGNIFEQNGRAITFTIRSSNPSWSGNFFGIYSVIEFWIDVDYTVLESGLTLNKTNLDAGQTIRANITAGDSSYRHRITWTLGTRSQEHITEAGVTYKDFTVPLDWLDQIPTALSRQANCKLETLAGTTVVGTVNKTFMVEVGASIRPTIGTFAATRVNNAVPSAWGVYVAGFSQATLAIGGALPGQGSGINKYSIYGAGIASTASSYTTPILNAGTHTYKATVTDSRGRVSDEKTATVTVLPYSQPVITGVDSFRCNSNGDLNPSGQYVKAIMTFGINSISGKNAAKVRIDYRLRGASGWTSGYPESAPPSGGYAVIGTDDFATTSSYEIRYRVIDSLGKIAEYIDIVGTIAVFMHKRSGGLGLGLGSYCEEDKRLQLANDWEIVGGNYTGGDILNKLKTVDGAGSGLDADLFKGLNTNMFGLIAANSQTGITNKSFNFSPTGYGAGAYLLAVYSAWSTSSGNFGLYYIAASGSTYGAVLPIIAGSNITTTFTASTQTLEIVCVNAARMSLTRIGNTLTYD